MTPGLLIWPVVTVNDNVITSVHLNDVGGSLWIMEEHLYSGHDVSIHTPCINDVILLLLAR